MEQKDISKKSMKICWDGVLGGGEWRDMEILHNSKRTKIIKHDYFIIFIFVFLMLDMKV